MSSSETINGTTYQKFTFPGDDHPVGAVMRQPAVAWRWAPG
ncbi:MAG: hypothetical protein OXF25_11310 [Cyanobacteria bacterium MAG CAR3_bin_5]|nr:hypothetical protein [Cyanobacteria bacterium MAG CAR3_bin_5]